ncbi:MAG: metallophosphoesterase, partial [Acidimicrobiales bacterium]
MSTRPLPLGAGSCEDWTMEETWITSDLHVGHANIIRYCSRPFSSVEEMNEAIVEEWNTTVRPADRVLVLGDVALGKITDSLAVSARLSGHKVLLAGNHDRCAAFHGRKSVGWEERYRHEGGFAEVHQGTMRIDLGSGHPSVLACHFPYVDDTADVMRFAEQRPVDAGEWIVHGHVHERWLQAGRQINVSLDAWGGRLAHADEVVAMIEAGTR